MSDEAAKIVIAPCGHNPPLLGTRDNGKPECHLCYKCATDPRYRAAFAGEVLQAQALAIRHRRGGCKFLGPIIEPCHMPGCVSKRRDVHDCEVHERTTLGDWKGRRFAIPTACCATCEEYQPGMVPDPS